MKITISLPHLRSELATMVIERKGELKSDGYRGDASTYTVFFPNTGTKVEVGPGHKEYKYVSSVVRGANMVSHLGTY